MSNKSLILSFLMFAAAGFTATAANVQVTMNNVSTTMKLTPKGGGADIAVGTPSNKVYNFTAPAGEYILTGFATDGTTVNGTICITITDSGEELQKFAILTHSASAKNKNADGSQWSLQNGDYSVSATVNEMSGEPVEITLGNSADGKSKTFLAPNPSLYSVTLSPGEARSAEGYMDYYKAAKAAINQNISAEIPMGDNLTITVPKDASFFVGIKRAHYVDFVEVEPVEVKDDGANRVLTYKLGKGQTYNYRTSKPGGLTNAGIFAMNADEAKRPNLIFTDADYASQSPAAVVHDVFANGGYEVGDIFVNINERGHLRMNVGDTFDALALRNWQIVDNITNNYYIQPDFNYTLLNLDGTPSTGVIELEHKPGSEWADIKAVGAGTAIVLVTYDAIKVNLYGADGVRKTMAGGDFWGAIWPENTAAYVVTVGEEESAVKPQMKINADLNSGSSKVAGENVDAEHDVFYYLDGEQGATYTFTPENAAEVTMAYPTIGERMATYSGFGSEGVTANADGSYTLLLKQGRQIVRLADASGRAVYQVLTAKKCTRDIINETRPGSKVFQPGDKVKIQYGGLFHSANKTAALYNMSSSVNFGNLPAGVTATPGKNQYQFASTSAAQAVTVAIKADYDVAANPELDLKGALKIEGFGDPIGSHRTVKRSVGLQANFNAISHNTFFGALPAITIPVSAVRNFDINIESNVADATYELTYNGAAVAVTDGKASGSIGTYYLTAKKDGYRCFRGAYEIADNAEGTQTFVVEMTVNDGGWDGTSKEEPQAVDGVYQISSPAHLAWFAAEVNAGKKAYKAKMLNDIDLAGYDWTPIGNTKTKYFGGEFTADGHRVDGLYVNGAKKDYMGLFGYVKGTAAQKAIVDGVVVSGRVFGKAYSAGVVGCADQYSQISTCANEADVIGAGTCIGGVVGYLAHATASVANCYNTGAVKATDIHAGVVGGIKDGCDNISGVFNVGEILDGPYAAAVVGSAFSKDNVQKSFAVKNYSVTSGHTLVTPEEMASGKIAYQLGYPFGQEIGVQTHPVFFGEEVKYHPEKDVYYNGEFPTSLDELIELDIFPELYYNVEGIASLRPYKGINIVRMSDGSVRKIYVK